MCIRFAMKMISHIVITGSGGLVGCILNHVNYKRTSPLDSGLNRPDKCRQLFQFFSNCHLCSNRIYALPFSPFSSYTTRSCPTPTEMPSTTTMTNDDKFVGLLKIKTIMAWHFTSQLMTKSYTPVRVRAQTRWNYAVLIEVIDVESVLSNSRL